MMPKKQSKSFDALFSKEQMDSVEDFYVFDFPNGLCFFFNKMKEVKQFLNGDSFQDLVQKGDGMPLLAFVRKGDYPISYLDYDKWIEKD